MADLSEDELYAMERAHRADETERCALLCEMRADISIVSADRVRKEGTFTARAIWPPFKKTTHVAPKWEYNAHLLEEVAKAFRVVANCIRKGYDPRELKRDPNEQIRVHAAPTNEAERLDAIRAAHGLEPDAWVPCSSCIEPADCASWQACEKGIT